jgi:2-dehydro-3-deoxy-D-arabinonate dehydratase
VSAAAAGGEGAGLFRVELPDGSVRWAAGEPVSGPLRMLPLDASLDALLARGADLAEAAASADEEVPPGARTLAPIGSQEVWAAGVTYLRSREARVEETADRTPYDLVYEAERPELFWKSVGWRVAGPGQPVGIRSDSTWDVPEPELALVLDSRLRIAGYAIGDDLSSRSIEGDNALYLPQAKVYDGSCAIGPCVVPAGGAPGPFEIRMRIVRGAEAVFEGRTSTAEMRRSFEELARALGAALSFPVGAFLLTGTGVVPDASFTLRDGDSVRIEVDGLGTLSNPVVRVG